MAEGTAIPGAPVDCNRCPLSKTRKHVVNGRGHPGSLCFVGLGPGEEEDQQGKAFVGQSGQLLRLLCEMAGISPQSVYLMNATRCHSPGNRRPTVAEIRACRPFLLEELAEVKPAVIVTLGDVALQSVYGQTVTLSSVLGQTLTQLETGIPFIPSYHPAFLLRGQWHVADTVQAHFEKALRIASGELGQPRLGDYSAVTTLAQLTDLRDYLLHADTKEVAFDCVTPDTPILRSDLRWVKAGDLKANDELLCFDEGLPADHSMRRYCFGRVVSTGRRMEERYEVQLSSGEVLLCTGSHRWLVWGGGKERKGAANWVRTDELARTLGKGGPQGGGNPCRYRIARLFHQWPEDRSYEAGLLAGLFDADGCLSGSGKGAWGNSHRQQANLTGKDPTVLDEARAALVLLGFQVGFGNYQQTGYRPDRSCPRMWINGGYAEQLRFLGQVRPQRLLRNWRKQNSVTGHMAQAIERLEILSVKPIGVGEIVTLGTDTGTYIAAGFPAHNTETTGLDWRHDELLCISFSTEPGEGFVVPLLSHARVEPDIVEIGHRQAMNMFSGRAPKTLAERLWITEANEQGTIGDPPHLISVPKVDVDSHWEDDEWPQVIAILREIFGSDKKKVGQNAIFDLRFLERRPDWPFVTAATAFGIEVKGQIEDTMLLHQAVAETAMPPEARKTKRHSLAILTALYTDMPYYAAEVNAVSSNKRKMAEAPDNIIWEYSCADADSVERIVAPLRAKADTEGTRWASEAIIQPLIRCCWEMEKRGVLVDMDYFEKLCAHYTARIKDAEERLYAIPLPETKPPWNYMYHKNLQRILFEELGLPRSGFKTDGGRGCEACDVGLCFEHEQTGADALAAVRAQVDHPILPILMDLKELRKAKGTYLDGSNGAGGIARYIESDNRIRSTYRPGGTETTRLSSANPNMQNQPHLVEIPELGTKDAFHRNFTAPEGFGLMSADWSQAEVWGLAYMAGDEGLLKVLTSGQDVHCYIGRAIWAVDPEMTDFEWKEAHAELRRKAKCMAPETRVLTGDLRWVPLSEIHGGDTLLAFDEEPADSPSGYRRLIPTKVLEAIPAQKELFEIEFADGTLLRATADHPFLTDRGRSEGVGNRAWRTLGQGLKRALKVIEPWEEQNTYGAGWLAGFFDGEGSLGQLKTNGCWNIVATQRSGPEVDTAKRLLDAAGFQCTLRTRLAGSFKPGNHIQTINVVGGRSDRLRFLGSIRPQRLIRKLASAPSLGRLVAGKKNVVPIIRITPLGRQPVVSLETGSHTFIAEGFAVHNTLVFGIGYGLTDEGIADRLECSLEEAQEIRARYLRVVASLPSYFAQARRDVIELGHRDNVFGQRRHFPAASLLKAMRRFNDLEALIREGINYPIQSGCSTLHSAAHSLTEASPTLKQRQCYPVISVHDSITFEFYWPNHSYAEETARIIKHLWEQTAQTLILPDGSRLGWSIPVEVSWGQHWGDEIFKLTARGDILDLRKEPGEDQ